MKKGRRDRYHYTEEECYTLEVTITEDAVSLSWASSEQNVGDHYRDLFLFSVTHS